MIVSTPQRLLVSVRGSQEALRAAKGGAQIADVEYPASALGTPYPLNISSVRKKLNAARYRRVAVSTRVLLDGLCRLPVASDASR